MKNTGKNSSTNTWIYLSILLLLAIAGSILIYNFPPNKKKVLSFEEKVASINDFKDLTEEDYKTSNKDLVTIAHSNFKEKRKIDNKLLTRGDIKLNIEQRKTLKNILDNLELSKLSEESFRDLAEPERRNLLEKVYREKEKLWKINLIIDPQLVERLIKQYESDQNRWLSTEFVEERAEIESRLKGIIEHFYRQSRNHILNEGQEIPLKKAIPREVKDQLTNDDNYLEHVKYFQTNHSQFNYGGKVVKPFEDMKIDWKGFTGFLEENDKDEGKITLGVTKHWFSEDDRDLPGYILDEPNGTKTKFAYWNYCSIEIKLKKELLFSRLGNDCDYWVVYFSNDSDSNNLRVLDVSWDILTETIAHELAHAIINSLRAIHKGPDGEGHTPLHHHFTDKIREIMETSPKYQEFKKWWTQKW